MQGGVRSTKTKVNDDTISQGGREYIQGARMQIGTPVSVRVTMGRHNLMNTQWFQTIV